MAKAADTSMGSRTATWSRRWLAVVLALVLAACGGGSGDVQADAADDGGASVATDTDAETGEGGGAEDGAGEDGGEVPVDAADAPAPPDSATGDAGSGQTQSTGDGQPAGSGGGSNAQPAPAGQAAALDDAGALARALRVEDLPSGYKQQEETTGSDEDDQDFEEAFRRCLGAAGVDPASLSEPTGQASRTFSEGPASPQNPEGITSSVIGLADVGASERMVAALHAVFSSESGRKCIEEEIEKAIAEQAATAAPGATITVEAKALAAYTSTGGVAQLRLVTTVDFGAQQVKFVTDLVAVRAGNAVAIVSFTEGEKAFDPAVGQPIVDRARTRLAG